MAPSLADLERSLNLLLGPAASAGHGLPRALAMTDTDRAPDPAGLLRGLPRGGALILRDKNPTRLAEAARRWVPMAKRAGHKVLIAGNPRLALAAGAGGVHLSEAELRRRPETNWVRLRPDWIVTASAHGAGALERAARAGADAVLLSPVFPTQSHPDAAALGVRRFAALARARPIAVYALGGVNHSNMRRLRGTACAGIAGIGLFLADSVV